MTTVSSVAMATVTKRKTGSGHVYDVRWKQPDGTERRRSFKKEAAARAYRTQVEYDLLQGVVIDPKRGRKKFAVIADQWVKANPAKRQGSRERDRTALSRILPAIGETPVNAVTREKVRELVDQWSRDLAPSTVVRTFAVMRSVFSFAVAEDLIPKSPCTGFKLPAIPETVRPDLEPADLQRLAGELSDNQKTFLWCGCVLGLRWSEAAGLQSRDLDLRAGTITVARQLARGGQLGPPKSTAGARTMACPLWLLEKLADLAPPEGDGLIFTARSGRPLVYGNWRQRVWQPACQRAGLEGVTFHDLRSFATSMLVATGTDVRTVMTRLGHATPTMTLRIYARMVKDADRQAAAAVGEHFRPSAG
jgi:integrase